jgi:hypothetical protein
LLPTNGSKAFKTHAAAVEEQEDGNKRLPVPIDSALPALSAKLIDGRNANVKASELFSGGFFHRFQRTYSSSFPAAYSPNSTSTATIWPL